MDIWQRANGQPSPLLMALRSLNRQPVAPALGMRLRRISLAIEEHLKLVVEEHDKIIDLYAQKDEEGNPAVTKLGEYIFGDNEEAANAAFDELMGLTLEVKTIKATELIGLDSLPAEVLIGLGNMLVDDLEEGTQPPKAKRPPKRRK